MCDQLFPPSTRFVHAVALRDVRAHVRFAASDVDHVRVRGGDGDRADGSDRLIVEDRLPRPPGIARFPHAAIHAAEIEVLRLTRDSGDRHHATSAKRADEPPAQILKERRIDGRGMHDGRKRNEKEGGEASQHRGMISAARRNVAAKPSVAFCEPAVGGQRHTEAQIASRFLICTFAVMARPTRIFAFPGLQFREQVLITGESTFHSFISNGRSPS